MLLSDFPDEATLWVVGNVDGRVWKRLPIHDVCRHSAPLSIINELLEAFPGSPAYKDNVGSLPLHYACQSRAPFEVIEAICSAEPNAAKSKNRDGYTPFDLVELISDETYDDKNAILKLLWVEQI